MTIKWDSASRVIPADTRSIRIRAQVLEPDRGEITNELIVDRPQGQPVSSATLKDVPSVKVRLLASAHSEQNGGGTILAQGSSEVRVPENGSVPAVIVLDGTPPPPLVVTPSRAFAALGESVTFAASDPNVIWSSIGGGSITSAGVFSSNAVGTFSIVATSAADPGRIGTATVQVTEFPPFAHALVPFNGNVPQGTFRMVLPEAIEVFPASHRFFRDQNGVIRLEIAITDATGIGLNRFALTVTGFTATTFTLASDSTTSCSESVTFDPATGGSLGYECTSTSPLGPPITTSYTAPLRPLIQNP